ncbi:MAG: Fic family protein [Patescibacteria group bacterium]
MFAPKYTITNELLANIKRISSLITELNNRHFSHVVLMELERVAREVSAYASTSIEGNPLPLTEVKKILKFRPEYIRQSEKEVINYNQALEHLDKKLQMGNITMSLDLILQIHKYIMQGLLPDFEIGVLRKKPVVVNNPRTGQTVYLAPDVEDVKPLMAELINFVNENHNKIDSLILSGIFHKQMVLIHPFMDGNGRTTRLATKLLLAKMGLNTLNLFSFENYYNKNVTRYFQNVGEQGDYYELKNQIDFTVWLEYFIEGIIDELLRVQKILPKVALSPETELHKHHQLILDFLKEKSFIKDSDYAQLVNRAKATRALDFRKLIDLELIERKAKGKATYYILKEKQTLL